MLAAGLAPLIDAVRPTVENAGYGRVRTDTFVSKFSADTLGVVRFDVVGMIKRDVSVSLGVRFETIEKKKAAYERSAGYEPGGVHRYWPSIFQDMISSVPERFPGSISGYAKLTDENVGRLVRAITEWGFPFIRDLSDLSTAADYGFTNRNLALGAHAYRVPFMLLDTGRAADALDYMNYIASLNAPIGAYETYIDYVCRLYDISR